jgi:hypothetical protein
MLDGIFGDAPWTNRERLPDETLKNLIEHFSTQTLSVANVPEDELGNAYEYLIKKFADDSGHTAAEFYTNRTVVHLMTQLLAPQAGESIYDPTCGTGGMLISALDEVKRSGGEYRTLKLYGQERNLITSSIARMNLFLHGVEDFEIIRGDTLADPKHIEGDRLRQFDVILANPPYSIKQWNREAWSSDKWGRNSLGTPPQGRADYAFQQHILTSLTAKGRVPCSGRMACCSVTKNRPCAPRWSSRTGSRPSSAWAPTCSTTPRWSRASSSATARSGRSQGQGDLHRRGERGHPGTGAELSQARTPAAHPECFQDVCRCARFRQGRHPGRDWRQCGQPLDPAVREAHCRRHRHRQQWRRGIAALYLGPMANRRPCLLAADGRAGGNAGWAATRT